MGSELIKRGLSLNEGLWSASANITNPELVYQIHKEYIDAGADYITTNSFRTTPRAYSKISNHPNYINDAKNSLLKSIKIAKSAAKKSTIVIGSIAPLEDCYKPNLFPNKKKAFNEFTQLGRWLKEGGVDIIMLETMNSIDEAQTALEALSNFNLPIWISFVLLNNYKILSGETLKDVIQVTNKYKIEKFLLNCNSLQISSNAVNNIVDILNCDWGIYPNLGIGKTSPNGKITKYESIDNFIKIIKSALSNGASIVGGCCGSSPIHIKKIQNLRVNKK